MTAAKKRILFMIFFTALMLVSSKTFAVSADYMRADIYSVSEYDKIKDFSLNTLAKTSLFCWTDESGNAPTQRYQNGLPGYVLLQQSNDNIAAFYSVPSEPIDAYNYDKFSFAVKILCGEYDTYTQKCQLILTLHSEDNVLECKGEINSGIWNVINFDIGAWKYRKAITAMSIEIVGSEKATALRNVEFSGPYVNKSIDAPMRKFMSDWLSAPGAAIEFINQGHENEALKLHLESQRISISGEALVPYKDFDCNTIKLVLSNNSDLENMQFSYVYLNGETGKLSTKTKNLPLRKGSESFTYLIDTENCHLISFFEMTFDTAGKGDIIIHSIEPVSIYKSPETEDYGSIKSCKADEKKNKLTLEGTVHHSFLISHDDHTLLCYKMRIGESFEDIISQGASPVAKAKMSSKFSFEMKLSELGDLAQASKYAVAACSPEGELTLLSKPKSVEGDFGYADTASGKTNIKGLNGEHLSSAVDIGVGTAIIDVYLDKLINQTQSGYIYTIENSYVYFDADYVSQLDHQIKNLYASDCNVYLRLLLSSYYDLYHVPFASPITGEIESEFLSIDIEKENAEKYLFATIDFISKRYSKDSNGMITGMILGKNVDQRLKSNYSCIENPVEYSKNIANTLEIIARTAIISIPNFEILLSISDEKNSEDSLDSQLLLTSVSRYLEENGGLEFSVVLEGTRTPYSISADMFNAGTATEDEPKKYLTPIPTDPGSSYYCADDLETFEGMLSHLSLYSSCSPKTYIYCWKPDTNAIGNGLSAAYIYNYYSIMFSKSASAFVMYLENDDSGKDSLKKLSYLMKYIDTERNLTGELCRSALDVFKKDSFEDLIEGYNEELITYRVFHETSPMENLPSKIKGQFELWNFSSAFGVLDWFAGNGCRSVYIDSSSPGRRALCADIYKNNTENEFSEIVYRFEYPEDISLMPYIEFVFDIDNGGANSLYEIVLTIGGKGHRLESKMLAHVGREERFIINTSDPNCLEQIDYIRFSIRYISGDSGDDDNGFKLYLKKVSAYSDKYDDQTLSEKIIKARAKARNTILAESSQMQVEPNHDFIIAMVIIIVLAVAIVGFYDRKQK